MTRKTRDEDGYQKFLLYINESGLFDDVRGICLRHHVTMREIYLDIRGPSVYAARLEVWWWMLSTLYKSHFEIGRIFDRDAASVQNAIMKLRKRASELGDSLSVDNVHSVTRQMSKELTESRIVGGVKGSRPKSKAGS